MYRVKIDGKLFYDPRMQDYQLTEAKLQQEVNKAGTFAMRIYPQHPLYTLPQKMQSIVIVQQDQAILFRGRVLNENIGFYGDKLLTCEGQLAFLNDSIVRPYQYKGSVAGYLELLINQHNSQVDDARRFAVGNVTVTDPNDYITRAASDYPSTMTELQDKLVKLLGGYLMPRIAGDTVYLDYLADTDVKNLQDVEFGVNLLDLSMILKGQDITTAIIPLGAQQEDDSRLTIKSVNNGLDYVSDPETTAKYGLIYKTIIYDDVTLPENLLRKGREALGEAMHPTQTINVTAADLSAAGYDVQSFRFGRYEKVRSRPHGIDTYMLVSKMTTDLLNPASNKLTLGVTRKSYTEYQFQIQKDQEKEVLDIFIHTKEEMKDIQAETNSGLDEIRNTVQTNYTNATQYADKIVLDALTEYVKTGDLESFKETISTQFQQTAEDFTFNFSRLVEQINTMEGESQSQFAELKKYIRFVNGNIVLGEENNPLILTIRNDRIAFTQAGVEVAYFSNSKMYVKKLEVTEAVTLVNLNITLQPGVALNGNII
ncbi:phage tail spike protein [Cuneatibacter caecimuris]|uniref:Phage minor structural protein n=1 Tax=Cuneatibacter caecimuris TaxID=1796618 RepID=A0A4Q7PKS7_9FIRM|nr:phage tail spike protein [Cuneatibacter caecimuris]RZT00897.1 phage minor structural protein [Cuneatibacter caecimuris]